jgi:hypothetical protein
VSSETTDKAFSGKVATTIAAPNSTPSPPNSPKRSKLSTDRYLLRSPVNAERLLRSIADAEAGRTQTQELIDPQHDLA